MIIQELNLIQKTHSYLPADELQALSRRLNVPLYRLHGLASFYPHFRLQPPPKVDIRVCHDMTCLLRGATDLQAIARTAVDASSSDGRTSRHHGVPGSMRRRPRHCRERPDLHRSERPNASCRCSSRWPNGRTLRRQRYAAPDNHVRLRPPTTARRRTTRCAAWCTAAIAPMRSSKPSRRAACAAWAAPVFPTGVKWELVQQAAG